MSARLIGSQAPLILASASPRRADLLAAAGIDFERCPADVDETMRAGEAAEDYVVRLAASKARASWRAGSRSLGADTVVVLGVDVLGKPGNEQEAKGMLQRLSGRSHRVLTGVAVFDGERCNSVCEETHVSFRILPDSEIDEYVSSGEPLDKAGAYGIQGAAAGFVDTISGSYTNVVGLPVDAVERMLL